MAAQLPVTSQLRFEALSSSLNLNMRYARQWKRSLGMATSSKDILSANGQHGSTLVSLFRGPECSGLSSPLFFEAFAKILLKCIRLRTIAAGGMCIKRQQNSGG